MAAISVQTIGVAGITPTYSAASASDTIPNAPRGERLFIHAKNTNAATATITITPVAPSTVKVAGAGTLSLPNIAVTIPATTGDKMIGPIPDAYIDATGTVTLTNSGTVTNLTIAAVTLPSVSF